MKLSPINFQIRNNLSNKKVQSNPINKINFKSNFDSVSFSNIQPKIEEEIQNITLQKLDEAKKIQDRSFYALKRGGEVLKDGEDIRKRYFDIKEQSKANLSEAQKKADFLQETFDKKSSSVFMVEQPDANISYMTDSSGNYETFATFSNGKLTSFIEFKYGDNQFVDEYNLSNGKVYEIFKNAATFNENSVVSEDELSIDDEFEEEGCIKKVADEYYSFDKNGNLAKYSKGFKYISGLDYYYKGNEESFFKGKNNKLVYMKDTYEKFDDTSSSEPTLKSHIGKMIDFDDTSLSTYISNINKEKTNDYTISKSEEGLVFEYGRLKEYKTNILDSTYPFVHELKGDEIFGFDENYQLVDYKEGYDYSESGLEVTEETKRHLTFENEKLKSYVKNNKANRIYGVVTNRAAETINFSDGAPQSYESNYQQDLPFPLSYKDETSATFDSFGNVETVKNKKIDAN